MYLSSSWVRKHFVPLAIRNPGPTAGVVFLFLFTLSNHFEFLTGMTIQVSPFAHILATGAVFALFGAVLLYEVIRLHRKLAEVKMVRTVVSTLHHEINNPLLVIQFSAEKMQALQSYDETSVSEIIAHGTRIRDVVVKLSELDHEVQLHQEHGFENLIDVARSR